MGGERALGDPGLPESWDRIAAEVTGVYSLFDGCPGQVRYDDRHGIVARHVLTVVRPEDAKWILDKIRERVRGKVVVEIGAGIGTLANAIAQEATHVFAIEADPGWSTRYAHWFYRTKPANLTWIFDRAENLEGIIRGDVAIVVTGSAEDSMRELAERFAPEVIMPWQDFREGKALSRVHPFAVGR
jgi:protein-L-isoaspartate O-methyltransferase